MAQISHKMVLFHNKVFVLCRPWGFVPLYSIYSYSTSVQSFGLCKPSQYFSSASFFYLSNKNTYPHKACTLSPIHYSNLSIAYIYNLRQNNTGSVRFSESIKKRNVSPAEKKEQRSFLGVFQNVSLLPCEQYWSHTFKRRSLADGWLWALECLSKKIKPLPKTVRMDENFVVC